MLFTCHVKFRQICCCNSIIRQTSQLPKQSQQYEVADLMGHPAYEVKIVRIGRKQLAFPAQMSFFSHWGSVSNSGSVATATAASSSASLPSNHPLQEMLNRQQMTAAATAASAEPRFNWAKERAAPRRSPNPFFQ